jgi:hypothetical protein
MVKIKRYINKPTINFILSLAICCPLLFFYLILTWRYDWFIIGWPIVYVGSFVYILRSGHKMMDYYGD